MITGEESFQNRARLKSTQIQYFVTNFILIIERDAVLLFEKLRCLPNNTFWRDYDVNTQRNLKTQKGVIQCAYSMATDLDIHQSLQVVCGPICPLDFGELLVHLKLDIHVFTDGSLFDDEDGAGADLYSELFSYYAPIGAHSTYYDGEIEVI